MSNEAAELAVALAFAERLQADRARGAERTADEYAALFPGFEHVVAAEFARLSADATAVEIALTTGRGGPRGRVFGAPERLGPYRIDRELGRGGQGSVYLAVDERLGRRVALKLLSAAWAAGPDALRRFEQEARALAAIDHPGLCPIYETAVADGVPYIAMRYVDGETLAARLARRGAPADAAEIAAVSEAVEKTARAVHAAHEAGYVHRDLKPANVMLGADGEPVVLDFGLARREDRGGSDLTATGEVLGTPAYMAPEQASGDVRAIDRRTDVWALGAILYESVVGARPFLGATAAAVLDSVRNDAPPSVRSLNPRASKDLGVVVATALAKRPTDRYATAFDFAEDLRRLRAHEPIRARRISAFGRLVRWSRRRPAVAALCAVLAALLPALAALGGWYVAKLPDVEAQARARRADEIERNLARAFWLARVDDAGFERSATYFRRVLALDPANVEAACGLARVEAKAGRGATALAALGVFAAAHGEVPLVRRTEAELLRALGSTDAAREIEATLPPPRSAVECFFEGLRTLEAARTSPLGGAELLASAEVAIDWFEKAMERSPRFRHIFLDALAQAVGASQNLPRARRVAETAKLMLSEPAASSAAGFALLGSDPDAAVVHFRTLEDGTRMVDFALATSYVLQDRLEEAVAAMNRYAEARPDDATAQVNVAIFEVRRRNYPGVERAASRAVRLRPDLPYAWHLLVQSQRAQGKPPEHYLETLRAALRAAPENVDALVLYAETAADIGRRDEAISAARKATELSPRRPDTHAALGRALMHVDASAARRAFVEAGRLRPGSVLFAAMAAVAAASSGDGPGALAHANDAEEFLRRDPQQTLSGEYQDLLKRIRSVFGAPASRPTDDEDEDG